MAGFDVTKQCLPLTCHGHSRPVTHISFSGGDDKYYFISACKDNNPMLRDGVTGDWIGTFFGHKGAVYQSRLSPDATIAATASADFTAKIWNTYSGETLYTIQHDHIVRAIAFPPDSGSLLATGGMEKKLRIFDLSQVNSILEQNESSLRENKNQVIEPVTISASEGFEIGPGIHKGTIKAIVWTRDPNVLVTAADDKIIRWWDLRTRTVVQEQLVEGDIGSCEFTNVKPDPNDIGEGLPVLCIAAGKSVYFYGGMNARKLIKIAVMPKDVASVALSPIHRKFVVGWQKETWTNVFDFDTEKELDVNKGHHGPVWSVSYSPDGNLYATASEDGTIKMWKNTPGPFGLWRAN
ncbi:Serine-threonine kinase receptor-associated protein [Golovinomyces cichoracearum]|uniref:Serine-threonine kinase receptor-associated protein n=1 Tax=Golovinomyces cichoracearum TaxID=62708 RepID=A0A420INT0_9PEZI|nr:Serine-threonine kinase receptor-associated protein [Golovinomyces cichoracearum]